MNWHCQKPNKNWSKRLAVYNKPLVLVLVQGRPRIIREIEPLADAVVMAYLPGDEGGRALSDILYGKTNPSGKLPYTYPKYSGNALPYFHKKTDIRDVNWAFDGFYPQYEFGQGLSYTTFAYSEVRTDKDSLSSSETLNFEVSVQNTGNRAGKEVVQLFLKDLIATVSPDVKRLVRFEKINLQPGETQTVSFQLQAKDFASIGLENKWLVEPGSFELTVGGHPKKRIKKEVFIKN